MFNTTVNFKIAKVISSTLRISDFQTDNTRRKGAHETFTLRYNDSVFTLVIYIQMLI